MDSLTQFALGATIGVATLGRKIGARKAAVTGGLLATLPDLDVLIPFDNPVDSFILHRGATHSLIIQTIATPFIAEALRRFVPGLNQNRVRIWATVWLCLTTHALLDAMTVYGTRLFWPLWPEPVGLGSVFIIDPLYTLPLLVIVVWALIAGHPPNRLKRASAAALAVSTIYLGWSVFAQNVATARGKQALNTLGISAEQIMATPTPFNTLFWRVIAVDGARYYNVYVPLLGGPEATTIYGHRRGEATAKCIAKIGAVRRLAAFADGFFRLERQEGALVVSDLRMGLTPNYVFRFAVAPDHGSAREDDSPVNSTGADDFPKQLRADRDFEADIAWLKASVAGNRVIRPAEANSALPGALPVAGDTPTIEC